LFEFVKFVIERKRETLVKTVSNF